jgi:GcrA cell cycle regulator
LVAPRVEAVPETGTATVVSVRYGQCRWPIGDPLADGFCLCGRRAERGAYCAGHGALAYRPTPRDHLLRLAGVR